MKYNIIAAAFIAFVIMGCSYRHDSKTNENIHKASLQLTAYNSDFEVFIEAEPFAAGQTSEIFAHFSHLENFKPLAEGSVTIHLRVGTDDIRQTIEQPVQEGIYRFSIQSATAGEGQLLFDVQTSKGVSQLLVPHVTVYANEREAQQAATDAVVTSNNSVLFSKGQSWKIDFATTEVRREPFGPVIRTTAQIQPSQGDERVITAQAGGVAFFSNDQVVEGKAVSAGQALFSIDDSSMADNNLSVRYAEAESEYQRAKAEYDRKNELVKENIVSQSDWLKAKTDFTNAEAVYNNLKKNFTAGKQAILSPISGFITSVLVRNGEYVEAGQPVLVVSQNRKLLIKAELQPKYFDRLSHIVSANIRLLNTDRTYTLEELDGRVISYGKSTHTANPLIPVLFQVNNKAGLLPGSFVELFIITRTNQQAIAVPNESIVEEMGNYFVYVQLTPELFEKRMIEKGATDGIRVEITKGIAEGERVVSKGAILVKLTQASGSLDAHAGHAH
ncbi:MAG: efflux RND transporter periplasmic adaptor subunit [Candidatus Azobacteroides sp.]|nr:efflux RND transporter periplasmic adaptor subunit [Candidatus Azobacteroides sp.]